MKISLKDILFYSFKRNSLQYYFEQFICPMLRMQNDLMNDTKFTLNFILMSVYNVCIRRIFTVYF